jgi:hypothetical protein
MQVSREFLLEELKLTVKQLKAWIKDIEDPMEAHPGGGESRVYPEGVPMSISIADLEGIPENQLRAELMVMAGKLEALAAT